jgi:hypothetical protein
MVWSDVVPLLSPPIAGTCGSTCAFSIPCNNREEDMIVSLRSLAVPAALCLCVGLSGCGTTPGDRAVSGGLLGAGTGAVIGSIAGGAGQGALIGGIGGALIGAVTSASVLYMGEPPWHHSGGRHYHHHRTHHASGKSHSKACDSNNCRND